MIGDPSSPQESTLIDKANDPDMLASRWERLGATMVDSLLITLGTLPTMYLTGGYDGITEGKQPSAEYNLFILATGLAFFALINFKLLRHNGQTIGKRLLGIRIVDLDGNLPGLQQIFSRYAVYFLPGNIPGAGPVIYWINVLFIFREERRCLHDYAGGTRVVRVAAQPPGVPPC